MNVGSMSISLNQWQSFGILIEEGLLNRLLKKYLNKRKNINKRHSRSTILLPRAPLITVSYNLTLKETLHTLKILETIETVGDLEIEGIPETEEINTLLIDIEEKDLIPEKTRTVEDVQEVTLMRDVIRKEGDHHHHHHQVVKKKEEDKRNINGMKGITEIRENLDLISSKKPTTSFNL